MYNRLFYIVAIALLGFQNTSAQDLSSWDKPTLQQANTAQNEHYLTEEEKKTILLMNLARMNGQLFAQTILKPYLAEQTFDKKYTQSLLQDLNKLKPLSPLLPDEFLYQLSKNHAVEMGKKNTEPHQGVEKRFEKMRPSYNRYAENCDFYNHTALNIVMSLLIDEHVSSLGHRKNILQPNHSHVGVAIAPHIEKNYTCVQLFGGS
jgi:uncharacterized protein YkwD